MTLLIVCAFAILGTLYFHIASRHCAPSTINIIHIRQLIESRRTNRGPLVEPSHFKRTCSGWFVFYFGVELRSEYHQESSTGRQVAPCRGPPHNVLPCHGGSSHYIVLRVSTPSRRLLGIPYPPCKQLLAVVVGGAVVVNPCWAPLPVITHMHQPSSLQAVACSGGVWCRGPRRLPLVPVIILSCIGGAGAGADGVGVGLVIIVVSSPPHPPSCSLLLWRW